MIEASAKSALVPVSPMWPLGMQGASALPEASAQGSFQARLMSHLASSKAEARDDAKQAAQQFVSTALVLPLLKQMRSSPFKSDYLHGGQGEDAFGPQLDQILADRIVERMSTPAKVSDDARTTPGLGLVDAVYRRIMRQADHQPAASNRQGVNTHG